MNINQNVKIGIVTGLIASMLFYYFLNPLLSLFGKILIRITSNVYSAYADNLFKKVALGVPQDSSLTLLIFFLVSLFGAIVGFYIALIKRFLFAKRPKAKPESKHLLKKSINSLIKSTKRLLIYGGVWIFIVFILYIWLLWGIWFQIKITTSFTQHMNIIAPYLSEDGEEIIWSQWSQMKTRADYERIYMRLNEIAEKNHIDLPENKVYSFTSF